MWFGNDNHKALIRELQEKNSDINTRTLSCNGETITLLYIKQLINREWISEYVIRPILEYCAGSKKPLKAADAFASVIYADDCHLDQDTSMIEHYILNGMAAVLFSNDKEFILVNYKNVERRAIPDPTFQYTLNGPKDCFIENLDTNISLLRYRLKDDNLRIEYMEVGQRTHTRLAMIYISDIANDTVMQEIHKRIDKINADGFLESGEVQAYLLNNKYSLFPNMMMTERSDMASEMLLEGKVLLLVDGSQQALAAPVAFVEFMYSSDDRYDNKYFGFFMRMVRYIAFFLSFTASSYWVAIVAFHTDILPGSFIISLAEARTRVPFSAVTGALLLEFILELIRETLLRVPDKIGSAIAIVGALIIGQAAITAGVFSPLLLIVVSIEFLASFATPNFAIINPFRLMKFLLLLITGMFGFYGFILGITVIVTELVSINSFGVPYLAPYAPFNLYDFLRTFIYSKTLSPERQQYMRNKDKKRTRQ